MKLTTCTVLLALASSMLALPAQTIDTIGGTNSSPTRANSSKASLYAVDTSVLLFEFEMYLDVPGPENLTFFAYRHHSRSGTATLHWTHQVQVTGGGGPQWYSTGPIFLAMLAGNHYVLGVSWTGSVTYYYSTSSTGTPVSFGSWQRAHTISNPLPSTLNIPSGVDIAAYHQRLTTFTLPSVTNIGTGCNPAGTPPRLVATDEFKIGTTQRLELVSAPASVLSAFVITYGSTLPTPLTLYNCPVWLDLFRPSASLPVVTSTAGYAALPFTVPNDPGFSGIRFATQAAVLDTSITMTNAINFTIL